MSAREVSHLSARQTLRQHLNSGELLVVPGAYDALSARIIEEAGFEAVYVTGAGFANAAFGLPDIGLVSSTELITHAGRRQRLVRLADYQAAEQKFTPASRTLPTAGEDT